MRANVNKLPKLTVYLDGSLESRALEIAFTRANIRFLKVSAVSRPTDYDVFPREVPALETQYGMIDGFVNIARYFDIPNLHSILDELKEKTCLSCGRET